MSRPSRRHPTDKHTWATVRSFVVSVGGRYVPDHEPRGLLMVIHADDTDEHPCQAYSALAQAHHQHTQTSNSYVGTTLTLVLDCTALTKDLPSELSTLGLGPVAKPVHRVVEKFNPRACLLVASTPAACHVAAKLLRDPLCAERVDGVLLVCPEFQPGFVRSQLRSVVTDKPTVAVFSGGEGGEDVESLDVLGAAWENAFVNLHKVVEGKDGLLVGYKSLQGVVGASEVFGKGEGEEGVGQAAGEEGEEVGVYFSEVVFFLDAKTKQVERAVKPLLL